ncbi:MAG: phosphoribosylanthranilate isomerase [Myxococcales bacterium]|nr:MAG: phosphoribosylanthranilate isomerase [Myxococcales bacterium]
MRFERFIQIAGVIDRAEAELLVDCGVRHLGFPLRLPVHREDLTEIEAAAIIAALAPPAGGVLITYLDRADDVLALCRQLGVSIVQLHGEVPTVELERLARIAADVAVIKSLVVHGDDLDRLERAVQMQSAYVDAFITDTHDSSTGASGATGKTHDWSISRRLVELSTRPVILAGGLTPDNVGNAIRQVGPAGVDTHTGVEARDGRKDRERVRRFLDAASGAFDAISVA